MLQPIVLLQIVSPFHGLSAQSVLPKNYILPMKSNV
jgi:hypothetical protein